MVDRFERENDQLPQAREKRRRKEGNKKKSRQVVEKA